jgi:hypothetical protein
MVADLTRRQQWMMAGVGVVLAVLGALDWATRPPPVPDMDWQGAIGNRARPGSMTAMARCWKRSGSISGSSVWAGCACPICPGFARHAGAGRGQALCQPWWGGLVGDGRVAARLGHEAGAPAARASTITMQTAAYLWPRIGHRGGAGGWPSWARSAPRARWRRRGQRSRSLRPISTWPRFAARRKGGRRRASVVWQGCGSP